MASGERVADDEATIENRDDHGSLTLPGRGSWASIEHHNSVHEDALIRAAGYWLDDEPGQVELAVRTDTAHITATVSPDRARQLGADLQRAADYAETRGDS